MRQENPHVIFLAQPWRPWRLFVKAIISLIGLTLEQALGELSS
jgi:hypothetical protein